MHEIVRLTCKAAHCDIPDPYYPSAIESIDLGSNLRMFVNVCLCGEASILTHEIAAKTNILPLDSF